MKDRQPNATGPQKRIPVISSTLHWWSMPLIGYMRHNFGFSFLSPKGIFLAFIWAQFLFAIVAFMEVKVWRHCWAATWFGVGAAILYLAHLAHAFTSQLTKVAKHDFYSGTSNFTWALSLIRPGIQNTEFRVIPLWVEPGIALTVGMLFWLLFAEHVLSLWLASMAAALWLKEFFNYWYAIRITKKHEDMNEDAEEKFSTQMQNEEPLPGSGGRKRRVKRPSDPSTAG